MQIFDDTVPFEPQSQLQYEEEEGEDSLWMEMNESEMRELEERARRKVRRNAVVSETVPYKHTCHPYPHPKTREERAMLMHMLNCLPFFTHLPEYRLHMIVDAFERCVVAPGKAIRSVKDDINNEFCWIERGTVISNGCSPSCPCCYDLNKDDNDDDDDDGIRTAPKPCSPAKSMDEMMDEGILIPLTPPNHEGEVFSNNENDMNNNNNSNSNNRDLVVVKEDSLFWHAGEFFCPEQLLYMYNPRVDHDMIRCAAPSVIPATKSILSGHSQHCRSVILWKINRIVLKTILMMDALRREQKLLTLLNSNTFLFALPKRDKLQIADALIMETHPPGTCLLQEGTIPDSVLFIDTGIVEVTRKGEKSITAHSRFLGRKACIGVAVLERSSGDNNNNNNNNNNNSNTEKSLFTYTTYSHTTCYRLRYCDMKRILSPSVLRSLANVRRRSAEREQHEEQRELILLEEQLESQRDAASGSSSEVSYTDDMCPVYVKTPEDDVKLQQLLSSSHVYGSATSMQRGLAVAAFSPRKELPFGYVLYSEDPTLQEEKNEDENYNSNNSNNNSVHHDNNSRDGRRPPQCLWVIADGEISITQRGVLIAKHKSGDAVGEELLLQKRLATPATTATITSLTCSLYTLDRKTFRCLLMPAYLRVVQSQRPLLISTPLASRLGRTALMLLSSRAAARMWMPGEVILPQGSDVSYVELVLDGVVEVTLWQDMNSERDHRNIDRAKKKQQQQQQQGNKEEEEKEKEEQVRGPPMRMVSTLTTADIIGALELLEKCRPAAACYIARSRVHTFRIPAAFFVDCCLQSPAVLEYLTELRQSNRYALQSSEPQLQQNRSKVKELML